MAAFEQNPNIHDDEVESQLFNGWPKLSRGSRHGARLNARLKAQLIRDHIRDFLKRPHPNLKHSLDSLDESELALKEIETVISSVTTAIEEFNAARLRRAAILPPYSTFLDRHILQNIVDRFTIKLYRQQPPVSFQGLVKFAYRMRNESKVIIELSLFCGSFNDYHLFSTDPFYQSTLDLKLSCYTLGALVKLQVSSKKATNTRCAEESDAMGMLKPQTDTIDHQTDDKSYTGRRLCELASLIGPVDGGDTSITTHHRSQSDGGPVRRASDWVI